MVDGAFKAIYHQMHLFLGDHFLRIQAQFHYASDDMDDASRGDIRNLKQTAEKLIEQEEGALHLFLALGAPSD